MDCNNCHHLESIETKDVNVPGGIIIRYECPVRPLMNNLRHFPFKNKTHCKKEKPKSQDLNFL